MHTLRHPQLQSFSLAKIVCILFLFCAATAIVSPAQKLTTLYTFCAEDNCADGDLPSAPLVQGSDGNFYGTTSEGGTGNSCSSGGGCGTVFKMSPSGALTTIYSFCSQPNCADGHLSFSELAQGADGNFYGTTAWGGRYGGLCSTLGCGTVFKITPSGTLTTLYTFCSQQNCTDGAVPHGGLVQGTDGNLYGTTGAGGVSDICVYEGGCGTVFKITPNGTLTTLYSFNGDDGTAPYGRLVLGTDGNYYGITNVGGANDKCEYENGCGTVFKITPSGTLTTLYSFCSQLNCTDGYEPVNGLAQGADGNFYGTTPHGGTYPSQCGDGCGTVFKITGSGTLTTLYSFCSQPNCTDGNSPYGALLQATDGGLYGTALYGGIYSGPCNYFGCGTVFKITPNGTLTTLYTFCAQPNCADGAAPLGRLVQGTDRNLYGTTGDGGHYDDNYCYSGCGTVFSLSVGPWEFVPVTPCRVVDTRNPDGTFGGPPIQSGHSRSFPIPQGACDIPASAAAYSLNVTVVPIGTLGYLTIWPTGENQPVASTLNSTDGRVKANAAVVPAGTSGAVSVYASNTTDVILDIDGYFTAPSSQTYQFYPLTPCRIVDTRSGDRGILHAGVERDYTIPPNCGVPNNATAYSFNVTVLPSAGGLDYLTVWPEGESRPTVSTLNDNTGTIVANAAIVPAGSENATAFYAHSNSTNLLLDVNGYFAPVGTGGLSLYPLTPCRVLDTRQVGNGQPFMGIWNPPNGVDVLTSQCAPPSTAKGFVFNATVVPSGSMPYLTLWPHGEGQPGVSTLNAYDGFITSNMAIVPTNDGSIDAYAAGLTQLILDISGYFAP